MAYIINRFNGEPLVTLQDATVDTSTSLQLVGRGYVGYGETQNENFLHLLENFANDAPPSRPLTGQLWFNTEQQLLNAYDGNNWIIVGSAIISEVPPASASAGSFWFNSNDNTVYVWTGVSWSFVGPETAEGFGITRARTTVLIDTAGTLNPVILLTVDEVAIAIISKNTFTLSFQSAINGFSKVTAGITLSTVFNISGNIDGTASRATRLSDTRTINGVGFNGTQDIEVRAVNPNMLSAGDYLVGNNYNGSQATVWAVDASSSNILGKIVARNSQGGFSAGTINAEQFLGNVTSLQGTSRFDIIEANRIIGPTVSGNADSASRLQTARTINGVAFNGTSNITVTASASTLTESVINSNVKSSSLETVGTLKNLSVEDQGISVGNNDQLIIQIRSNASTIISKTLLSFEIENDGPSISFLPSSVAVAQEGESKPAIVANTATNLGTPLKKFNKIYTNQLVGEATLATEATQSQNLKGGGQGSIPYQTAESQTAFLSVGSDNTYLRSTAGGDIEWATLNYEGLVSGTYINMNDTSTGGAVFQYNSQRQITISVDASANNDTNKIVARDNTGSFSATKITVNNVSATNATLNSLSATNATLNSLLIDNTGPAEIRFNSRGDSNVDLAISVQGEDFVIYEPDDNDREWFRINDVNAAGGNQAAFVYGNKVYAHNTITFTSGQTSAVGFTNQVGSFNNNSNYFDVFPPSGYTMGNLLAFIPSIRVIHFAGNVNSDDSLRCTWTELSNRVRVYVQNTEQRSTPSGNWLAIWRR